MTDFLESPPFPGCPRYGFISEPMYSVSIIERASGVERRNRNWAYPLTRLTITVGPSEGGDTAIQELLRFYHAVGGSATGFRIKDFADFKSCEVGATPAATDCPMLLVAGESPDEYQLVKRYTYGALDQDRPIYKPVQGTIVVEDDGNPKAEGVDYTINYTTGRVTLNFVPSSGGPTWGGEFDLPARFDGAFPVEIISHRHQAVSFTVREIRVTAP
jgi:uncharacterized protein (TIGR02217 family)